MLINFLETLIDQTDLSMDDMSRALDALLANKNPLQSAAFLALLQAKEPSVDEIVGLVNSLQTKMNTIDLNMPVLDIVGTGGDKSNTINISTGSALLAASCGVSIAKHGNRAVTSQCGTADVLEALGVSIDLEPEQVKASIEKYHFAFCFAPRYHSAFSALKDLRRALGIPTVFNQLGPLLNPANAHYLMMGVNNEAILDLMSQVVLKLPIKRAMIYTGCQTDEITLFGKTQIREIQQGRIKSYELDPTDYGFELCDRTSLQGGDPAYNATVLQTALRGVSNPVADTLILNAGIANYLYGLSESISAGIELAKTAHQSGRAVDLIDNLIQFKKEEG